MSDIINQKLQSYSVTLHMKRIVVVGVAGAGKTTLARQLALRLSLPYVELDVLYWDANWKQASQEVFRERVGQVISGNCWVIDGSYSKVRDMIWSQADTIIWLDYGLRTAITRLLLRTLRRLFTHEEFWNGNHESFRRSMFTRDSIIFWALKTYFKKQRIYLAAQSNPAYAHLNIIRLRSPYATQEWLSYLPACNYSDGLCSCGIRTDLLE